MRRLGLAVRHALVVLLAAAVVAWLLAYLGFSPFLSAFLMGSLAAFVSGWDKYSQLPPDSPALRPAQLSNREYSASRQNADEPERTRAPFPWRSLLKMLAVLVVLV